jgi:hypothetical protein
MKRMIHALTRLVRNWIPLPGPGVKPPAPQGLFFALLQPVHASIYSFQVGHVDPFGPLVLVRPRMSTRNVEAAEECAGNKDDPGKEERGIERAEHQTLLILQDTLLIRSLPFRSNSPDA